MIEERLYVRPDVYEKYAQAMQHNYFSQQELAICEVENGTILPAINFKDENGFERFKGGVVDKNGLFIEESSHYREIIAPFWGSLIEGYEPQEICNDDSEVIYGGMIQEHFGHFLIESTGRLWYYLQNGKNRPIAFVAPGSVKKFVYKFLELIGICRDKILIIKDATNFRKIIVPQSAFAIRNYYSKEFILPYQSNQILPKRFAKIYLTRRKFAHGPMTLGEKILERMFAINGYKVIAPEKLSLEEQIAYIKGAKSIAGIMGTATHLALFAKPGTELILINRSDDLNNNQIMVNQAAKLNCIRVDGHLNFLPTAHTEGPFVMGITTCFAELFEEKNYKLDKSLINYLPKKHLKKILEEWLRIYSNLHYTWLDDKFKPFAKRAADCIKICPKKNKWYHKFYHHYKTSRHKIWYLCGLRISKKRRLKTHN